MHYRTYSVSLKSRAHTILSLTINSSVTISTRSESEQIYYYFRVFLAEGIPVLQSCNIRETLKILCLPP